LGAGASQVGTGALQVGIGAPQVGTSASQHPITLAWPASTLLSNGVWSKHSPYAACNELSHSPNTFIKACGVEFDARIPYQQF
ncbi:hypothetical protein HAX54_030247, partial [Datura stramonium]|nr:hypothetical protein [Datura stramonium]